MTTTMRQIVLKKVPFSDGSVLSYTEMLLTITKTPNGQGVDGGGLAIWLPIQLAIVGAKSEEGKEPIALLTEDQWAKLSEAANSFKGYVVCPENGQFITDIKNAPSVEVAPV